MQETASKFLFDHNSQGNLKFEEPMSFSPFNTRFSNNNFDLFINKLNVSNLEDNSIFLNNKSMNSIKPFSAMANDKSHKNKQEELTPIILNFKESSNVGSNKSTPVDSRPKTIILQTSETSSSKKKKGKKKNQDEILLKEDDEKASKILKHPISKLRKSRQPPLRIEEEDTDSIYLRLYPHDLTTKSLMLKLNNFPRLEIKTSKKNYLKKVVDRLREKWLSKLNAQKDFKFDIIIRPDTENWLRHLDLISTKLNLPNDDSILTENYMLSDIWSGYNEPLSHKIDLYYQIKEVPKAREETAHSLNNSFKQEQPQPLKKAMTFMGLQVSQPKEQINFIKSEKAESNNKMEKLEKSDNILEHTGEKMNPYTGAEYFNMARRSASASRTSEKSNEGKSNGSSGFSFNEATGRDSNMRASTQANGPNDQSLRILYSQLNQQFPDETKFTSQLAKPGQVLSSVGAIKQIPVKRKV